MKSEQNNIEIQSAYLIKPLWHFVFFIIGLIILLLIGIPVRFITGLSSEDDRVFAVEALFAGLLTAYIIRKWFHRELYLFPKLNLKFIYVWMFLSIYVFLFQPFE